MTNVRKLQLNKKASSYLTVIPKDMVEGMELSEGDKLKFTLHNDKIIITPLANPTKTAPMETAPTMIEGEADE